MDWARILAYIAGTVDQELLLRNEYLAAENRILKAQINGDIACAREEENDDVGAVHKIAHGGSGRDGFLER